MRTDRELLADALKLIEYGIRIGKAHDITEEIRARLAEPEEEPVAWLGKNVFRFIGDIEPQDDIELPLYRHPPRPADNDGVNLYDYSGPVLDQLTAKNQ